eukprot:m.289115 g.289115  ORF g.289115 m.289115 type:complete len:745 (-) comp15807_c0_seq1:1516-3750(-)
MRSNQKAFCCLVLVCTYHLAMDVVAIQARLEQLQQEENAENETLQALLANSSHLEAKIETLQHTTPKLGGIKVEVAQLNDTVGATCGLAESVSSKVRELDLVKVRLEQCLEHVKAITSIKMWVDGVQVALDTKDYAKAAIYVQQYLDFEAAQTGPINATDEYSLQVLHACKERLHSSLLQGANTALEQNDIAECLSFVRQLPRLYEHEEALGFLGTVIKREISQTYQASERYLSGDTKELEGTKLFNGYSAVLEASMAALNAHSSFVETHLGCEYVHKMVVSLQAACDSLAVPIIERFMEARNLKTSVATSGSLDTQKLDTLLAEVTAFLNRTALYFRFLNTQIKQAEESGSQVVDAAAKPTQSQALSKLLHSSALLRIIHELRADYVTLESAFVSVSMKKAMERDELIEGQKTTTVGDDCFFIAKKATNRAMLTTDAQATCATINNLCASLTDDLLAYLMAKIQQARASGLDFSALQGKLMSLAARSGAAAATGQTPSDKPVKIPLPVWVNDLFQVGEFTTQLHRQLMEMKEGLSSSWTKEDDAQLSTQIDLILDFKASVEMQLAGAMADVAATGLTSKLKLTLDELPFSSYELEEEDVVGLDSSCPQMIPVQKAIDAQIKLAKSALLSGSFPVWCSAFTELICDQLETIVLGGAFNQLGALQLERDVASLSAFISRASDCAVRDKFQRLNQICTLLSLDEPQDVYDVYGKGRTKWIVASTQVKKILLRRKDFASEKVAALRV